MNLGKQAIIDNVLEKRLPNNQKWMLWVPDSWDPLQLCACHSPLTLGQGPDTQWGLKTHILVDCSLFPVVLAQNFSSLYLLSRHLYRYSWPHEVHFLLFCPLTQWLTVGCLHQCDPLYQKSLMSFICEFPRRAWFLRQEFTSCGFFLFVGRLDSWELNHFKLGRNISQRIFNFGQY